MYHLQLDERICVKCPLGPVPMTSRFCKRCEADEVAVTKRRHIIASADVSMLTHRGVYFGPALEYDLLPQLLPLGDPANELAGHAAA